MTTPAGAPVFSEPTTEARDRAIPAAVQEAARGWELYVDLDDPADVPRLAGAFLRCAKCSQSVLRLAWGLPTPAVTVRQRVTAGQAQDATLAHLLQVHRREVDPEWSGS